MTKLHRAKIVTGDPSELGCDYKVQDGDQKGRVFSTRLWELFMESDVDRADENAFAAAKAAAVAFLATVQERSPQAIKLMAHGDNAKTGDSCAAPDTADPIKTMRDTWNSIVDNTWSTRGGIDPATLAIVNLVAERLISTFGETRTAAEKAAKDDRSKAIARLARKRGVPVADYRAKLESHLAAQADL
ncbi:MAG: hypothetical protein ACYS8I_16600 [Planctomycetota bacterium]|jgi:hypothetical protein